MAHDFITLAALAALVMLTASGCAPVQPMLPEDTSVQVMIVPSYHMDPQGADVVNIEAADVRTPPRQQELDQLARALSAFQPTALAIEREGEAPDYLDPVYKTFTCSALLESKNERVQIAYRLAHGLNIDRVYAIDEQPAEGEPDYFPFGSVVSAAAEQDRSDELEHVLDSIRNSASAFAARQATTSVPQLLLELATGDLVKPDLYYNLTKFDKGEAQPASELHAYWFMRNAKIFSKLHQVARPGDRIVVVYGAGHAFWLNHFVERTAGFTAVDVVPYLSNAVKSSRSTQSAQSTGVGFRSCQ